MANQFYTIMESPPATATTNIIGYFNANNNELNFNSAALGINVTLPKGAYILDRNKNKVNDPRLEAYVLPGCLSKEVGTTPIPINGLASPRVTASLDGGVKHNGMGVFSVKADKIEVRQSRLKPKETQAQTASIPKSVLDQVARQAQVVANPSGSVKAMTMEDAKSSGVFTNTTQPRIKPQLPHVPQPRPPVQLPEPHDTGDAGDTMQLEESEIPQAAPIAARFVCRADNVGFAFRSQLKKYVKRKYPDRLKELVDDPYPMPTAVVSPSSPQPTAIVDSEPQV